MTSLAKPRLHALLLSGFALFAVAIAGVGLFWGLVLQRDAALARD